MGSLSIRSQALTTAESETENGYEPPEVLATFPRQDLIDDLPENLTPHVHAVQSS